MFNQYQPNLENMQQYLNKENEKSEGTNWWSIPAGMSSVRILPPWDPSGRVALPVYMHPIEYKGDDMMFTKYNWTCTAKTLNKPCQICEGLANLAAVGVDTTNWEANRRQFYFNAIVMHDPTYDQKGKGTAPGTHVLMKAPKTFYDWVIAQITNPMIGDITSVSNGIDVYITKEGTGLGTSYSMTLSPNGRTQIPKEYLDKVTSLYNIDEIFSAGFEQKQVDDMVNSLKKSAGALNNQVPSAINQMAGYDQKAPSNQVPFYFNSAAADISAAPNPYNAQQVRNPAPVAPNPYNAQPVGNPAPVAPYQAPDAAPDIREASVKENLPKCYGQYDAGNVNCVVCPMELDCSNLKGR